MNRVDTLTVLLERYHELTDPMQSRDGTGDGTPIPLMPRTWTPSVRELERLLRLMRDDRSSPLQDTPAGRVSVRRLWWHVNEWYLAATVTLVRPAKLPRSKGRQLQKALLTEDGKRLPVRRVLRHPEASERLATAGVEWLATHWGLRSEPMLPDELLGGESAARKEAA